VCVLVGGGERKNKVCVVVLQLGSGKIKGYNSYHVLVTLIL